MSCTPINPLLDLLLQLCMNPVQNYQISKHRHSFVAACWCSSGATWVRYSLDDVNAYVKIHVYSEFKAKFLIFNEPFQNINGGL